jgi:hypothetical protein
VTCPIDVHVSLKATQYWAAGTRRGRVPRWRNRSRVHQPDGVPHLWIDQPELAKLSHSKAVAINQEASFNMSKPMRSLLMDNGSLAHTPLILLVLLPALNGRLQKHRGVSDENIAGNSCIGDACEFIC